MSDKVKKILIIKPSALGDVVLAMPAVCCLKENFPDAQIHWFIRPEFAPLVESHKCVDKTVLFDRKKLGKWWYSLDAFRELVRLIKQLKDQQYDIVIDLQGRFRSAIFAWFSGCKKRIGLSGTQELTAVFYTQRLKSASLHEVDHYIDIICQIGAKRAKVDFGLKPTSQSTEDVNKILEANNIDKNNYAVIVPGATLEEKQWPALNFAELEDKIYEKYKCAFVAIGVKSESAIIEKIKRLSEVPLLNLAGKTTILQLVALIAGAKMVISNDTGPGHIAAALNVPVVVIYGNTNPLRLFPYARPWTIAAIDIDNRGTTVTTNNPLYDIKNISVNTVFEKICKQLS